MINSDVILWLLDSDISIQYQVQRDLLGNDDLKLRSRISLEGWGKQYLDAANQKGQWGQDYYQPKWISSHYTLLDLKNLNIDPKYFSIVQIVNDVLVMLLSIHLLDV